MISRYSKQRMEVDDEEMDIIFRFCFDRQYPSAFNGHSERKTDSVYLDERSSHREVAGQLCQEES